MSTSRDLKALDGFYSPNVDSRSRHLDELDVSENFSMLSIASLQRGSAPKIQKYQLIQNEHYMNCATTWLEFYVMEGDLRIYPVYV